MPLTRRFALTASALLAGFILGPGALDLLHPRPRSSVVHDLTIAALVVILFRDGLEVEGELLRSEWRLPLRKLILAMPLTGGLVALAGHVLLGLEWKLAGLLGALLASTDPVLSSGVVTNPRVPRVLRHSLNLESGLNDGLALTAVLAFSAALKPGAGGFEPVTFILQDVGVGVLTGALVAWVAARLLRGPLSRSALAALLVAAAAYGVAVLPPHGNALIAVFVCAIVFGLLRPDVQEAVEHRAEQIVGGVAPAIFFLFGTLLTISNLANDGLGAVAIAVGTLVLVRPLAISLALAGTGLSRRAKAFVAWFGPRGVATMAFGVLVLSEGVPGGGRVFHVAALTVALSVFAHGLSDRAGVAWISRAEPEPSAPPEPAAAA